MANDSFLGGKSFIYVNQNDPRAHLFLMYDSDLRTTPLGPHEFGTVLFFTVEEGELEEYVVRIFANGEIEVDVDGAFVGRGSMVEGLTGAAGFGPSPNFAVAHVMYELQVPLVPGGGTVYSPDPLFWSNEIPPNPAPRVALCSSGSFDCDEDGDGDVDLCCQQQGCMGTCVPPPPPSCPLGKCACDGDGDGAFDSCCEACGTGACINCEPLPPPPPACPLGQCPCDADQDGTFELCCLFCSATGACLDCQPSGFAPEQVDATAAVVTANLDGTTQVSPRPLGFVCPEVDEAALCVAVGTHVDGLCPTNGTYRNHGEYVSCVGQATEQRLLADVDLGCFAFDAVSSCVVNPRARSEVGK